MIDKLNPATKIPFVVNPVDDTQDPITWIQNGELLDGATSSTTQEGRLNKTGTQIQENIIQLQDNADVMHDKLNEVIDAVNDGTDSAEVTRIRQEIGPSSEAVAGETIYSRLDKAEDIISSLEGGAVSLTDWEYNNGSAIGGEMSVVMPEGVAIVTDVHINGSYQYPNKGYEWNPATRILKLATFLRPGDEFTAKISQTPGVPDSNSINNWVVYSWLYNDGSAVGGETTLSVSFAFYSVPAVYKNGYRYYPGLSTESYSYDTTARTITLTEPLVQGDRVIVQLGGEARPADQPVYEGYEPWLYNYGSAVGGEKILTLTGVTKKIARVHVNGDLQYPPQTLACTVDQTAKTIAFVDELSEGDVVLVDLGTDPFSISFPDYTRQEVARAANVKDTEVILSSDPINTLDGKTIIFDYVAQKYWRIPEGVPAGSTVGNVNGDVLTYLPSGGTVTLLDQSGFGFYTEDYHDIIDEPTSTIVIPDDINVFSVRTIRLNGIIQDVGYHFTFDSATNTVTLLTPITQEMIDDSPEGILVTVVCDISGSYDSVAYASIIASNAGASKVGTGSGKSVQEELDNSLKGYLTFETGGTLNSVRDLIYDGSRFYFWGGVVPKQVAANTKPTDIRLGAWVPVGTATAVDLIWKRNKITTAVTGVGGMLDSQWLSIYEFADRIVSKPTASPQTWDWTPAFVAARDYARSYVQQTAVSSAMWGVITLYCPAGVYQTSAEVAYERYDGSRGSLNTGYRIVGDGMTSTIFQSTTEEQVVFRANSCKFNLQDVGFRAGANYCQAVILGSATAWTPVTHSNWERVGISGFARGLVGNLVFDSSFTDVFVQNISNMKDTSQYSVGVDFPQYTGPANNSTDPTTGDCSNNIVFIRLTVETSNANNAIMLNLNGRNNSFAHHAFNFFGGHIETHNRNAKAFSFQNVLNINTFGTIFSQNGDETVAPTRVGYFNNATDVCMMNSRIITNNPLSAYSDSDVKMIAIEGASANISFPGTYVRSPYYGLATYNSGITYCIDTSAATRGDRSYDDDGIILNLYSNKKFRSRSRLTSASNLAVAYEMRVDSSNRHVWAYSTSRDDTTAPVDIMSLTSTGAIQTTGNVQIGAMSTSAVTRGIDWLNSGNQTTVNAYIRGDSVGRLYFSSYGSAQNWVMGSVAFNPTTDNTFSMGTATLRLSAAYATKFMYSATVGLFFGAGSPEGALSAGIGSQFGRTDGSAGTSFYVKETGTGNTGWVAK